MKVHYSYQDCRDHPHAFKLCSRAICVPVTDRCPCEYDMTFECSDGRCIPLTLYCNGSPDCPRGEDERSCSGGVHEIYGPSNSQRQFQLRPGELSTSIILAIVAVCVFVGAIVLTMAVVYIVRRHRNNRMEHSKSAMEPLQGERPSTSEDNDSSEKIQKKCLNSQYDKYQVHSQPDKHRKYYTNRANRENIGENEDCDEKYTDKYYNQTKVKAHNNYTKEQIQNDKNKRKGKHKDKMGGYVFVSRNQTTPAKLMTSYEEKSDRRERISICSSFTHSSSSSPSESPAGSLRFLDRDEFSNIFASGLLCASTPRQPVKFSLTDATGNISATAQTIDV